MFCWRTWLRKMLLSQIYRRSVLTVFFLLCTWSITVTVNSRIPSVTSFYNFLSVSQTLNLFEYASCYVNTLFYQSLSLSISLYLSLFHSLYLSFSLSFALSLFCSLSLALSLPLFLTFSFSPSLQHWLYSLRCIFSLFLFRHGWDDFLPDWQGEGER